MKKLEMLLENVSKANNELRNALIESVKENGGKIQIKAYYDVVDDEDALLDFEFFDLPHEYNIYEGNADAIFLTDIVVRQNHDGNEILDFYGVNYDGDDNIYMEYTPDDFIFAVVKYLNENQL